MSNESYGTSETIPPQGGGGNAVPSKHDSVTIPRAEHEALKAAAELPFSIRLWSDGYADAALDWIVSYNLTANDVLSLRAALRAAGIQVEGG
jgi:hypothetical protein